MKLLRQRFAAKISVASNDVHTIRTRDRYLVLHFRWFLHSKAPPPCFYYGVQFAIYSLFCYHSQDSRENALIMYLVENITILLNNTSCTYSICFCCGRPANNEINKRYNIVVDAMSTAVPRRTKRSLDCVSPYPPVSRFRSYSQRFPTMFFPTALPTRSPIILRPAKIQQ